jgi:hypothetical protein
MSVGLRGVFNGNQWLDLGMGGVRPVREETGSYMTCQSIGHQFEVAIGRNERDRAVVLEARQSNALMKFDILQIDALILGA